MRNTITVSTLTACALLTAAPIAHAASVVPRDQVVLGGTTADWAARWWQWGLGIPEAINPIFDLTGANCSRGQSGPVWFLTSSPSADPVTRSCTVPRSKYLFFPILTGIFGSAVFDCEPTVPNVKCDLVNLRKTVYGALNPVTLEASIDGVNVSSLKNYRVTTAEFMVTLPAGAVSGIPAGSYSPQVADGYWLMIQPLTPGAHTLHFRGEFLSGYFGGSIVDVTYNLTVP